MFHHEENSPSRMTCFEATNGIVENGELAPQLEVEGKLESIPMGKKVQEGSTLFCIFGRLLLLLLIQIWSCRLDAPCWNLICLSQQCHKYPVVLYLVCHHHIGSHHHYPTILVFSDCLCLTGTVQPLLIEYNTSNPFNMVSMFFHRKIPNYHLSNIETTQTSTNDWALGSIG